MSRVRGLIVIASVQLVACRDQVVGTFGGAADTLGAADSDEGPHGDLGGSSADDAAEGSTSASPHREPDSDGAGGSSSDGPLPQLEVCDGIDNDLDGLTDESDPSRSKCGGCELLQGQGQAWWVCEEKLPWDGAQARCAELGAAGARVADAATQAYLHEAVGQGWFWLGARQDADEGGWRWSDGAVLAYDNWGGTQPDNTEPGQDCVRLTFNIVDDKGWFDGAWDDYFCDNPHRVMCSAPHTP